MQNFLHFFIKNQLLDAMYLKTFGLVFIEVLFVIFIRGFRVKWHTQETYKFVAELGLQINPSL